MATREKRPSVARQNVSTACTQCRSSKLKCDGNLPKCKRCDVKKRECIYPSADDKRRVTLKKALEVFVRRVQQLDQFVACQGLVAPSIRPEDREIFDKVMGGRESSPLTSSSCVSYQSRGELGSGSVSADHAMQSTALSDLASGTKYNSLLPDGVNLLAQDQHPVGLPQAALICNAAPDIQPDGTSGVQLDNLEMSSSYSQDGPMVPITTYDSSNPFRYPFYNPDLGPESGLTHPTDFRDSGHNDFLEDDEDLISQLSNRMGHLHLMEDGQWRFFGATSNWNLAKQRFYNDTLANVPSTSQILPQPVVAREPLDPQLELQLELQLENLYFTWQDPCYHVVDRVMYEEGKVRWKTSQQSSTFYSPLLANAICAFGALFHKPRRRANELSQACASTARILLDIELDAPKVATAQALVILSSLEAAATKDARGWLYCGMAMRLSFDLGLHVDMEPYVALGQMTASEAKARCTAFWGCYVVDHLWGFYLGRPFHTNSGNITVHKPSANLYSRQQQTSTEVALGPMPVEDTVSKSFHEEVELMSAQWVFLGESMDALGNVMYGCNAVSKEDLVQVASNTMKNLIQWKQNLPPGLAIDIDNPSACPKAHLIVLHMQYYQIMIFIHRPFISEERNALGPLHGVTAQTSRSACLEAAFAISKLVGIYEKNYTLQRINIQAVSIIFSAALFLVFENISPTPSYDRETLAVHLEVCSQALAKLGEYFENASRSLDLLLSIKRDWKARLVAGNSWRIKRRRTSRFSVGTMSSKTKFQATGIEAGDDLHDGENAYPVESVFHDFDLIDSADWRYAVDDYCKASSS